MLCVMSLSAQNRVGDRRKAIRKIEYVLDYIDQNYIDEVPLDTLVEAALVAIFDKLDPHSRYMGEEEMRKMHNMMDSEFAGVGIGFTLYCDTLVVGNIIDGSPAMSVGLQYGDRITAIDSCSIVGLSRDSIASKLRGEHGSRVTIEALRHSNDSLYRATLVRDYIATPSVDVATMLNDTTAYIRVVNFARSTPQDFRRALAEMSNYRSLIIDLRGNTGGLLSSVIDICGIFLDSNMPIVMTEGRKEPTHAYRTKIGGELKDMPLTILIDEQSASASEIFAGAMQDNDRATIIGRTSYGKGLVQRLINLGDKTGMAVTRSHYKTPSGRAIQRPYTMGKKQNYKDDPIRYIHPDSITRDSSAIYYTLREHRPVYGDGGITPDIYVAREYIDTASYRGRALSRNVALQVRVELFDRKGYSSFIKQYPTSDDFASHFELDEHSLAIIDSAMYDTVAQEMDKVWLRDIIRASIAHDIYGKAASLKISMRYDTTLMLAIDSINSLHIHKNPLK